MPIRARESSTIGQIVGANASALLCVSTDRRTRNQSDFEGSVSLETSSTDLLARKEFRNERNDGFRKQLFIFGRSFYENYFFHLFSP